MKAIDLLKNAADVLIPTSLIYGVAYVGRTYLLINPLHAAIFSMATIITANLGKELFKKIANQHAGATLSDRLTCFISVYAPAPLAVATRVFSPLQAITAIGLNTLFLHLYTQITQRSPLNLNFS